jgi:hypothetical protein
MLRFIVVVVLCVSNLCYGFKISPSFSNILRYDSIQFDEMMSDNEIVKPYRRNNDDENGITNSMGPVVSLYDLINISNCYPKIDIKHLLCDTELFCVKNNINLITNDELNYIAIHIIKGKRIHFKNK